MLGKLKFYSVAETKMELSKLISDLGNGDSVITKNGVPVAAVMKYDKYVKMMDFMEKVKDLYLLDVDLEEIKDPIADILKEN